MTIRMYQQSAELTGNTPLGRKVGRFELYMATRKSLLAKPMSHKVEFAVTGTTEAAVDAGAIQIAEEILALSDAKGTKFCKILGHYRQDEIIPVVPVNVRKMAVIGYSPDPADGLEALNLAVRVPFFSGTLANAEALTGTRTAGGGTACLGYVRWQDQEETALEAMHCELYRGTNIYDMETVHNEPFTSANTENGLADSSLGPKI